MMEYWNNGRWNIGMLSGAKSRYCGSGREEYWNGGKMPAWPVGSPQYVIKSNY